MTKQFDIPAAQSYAHPEPNPSDAPGTKPLKERMRPLLMVGVPVIFAAAGYAYYLAGEPFVSTDNAYARVAKASVNARISGQVVEIASFGAGPQAQRPLWKMTPHSGHRASCEGLATTNMAYGGKDNRTLFITESESGCVLIANLDVPGRPMHSHQSFSPV